MQPFPSTPFSMEQHLPEYVSSYQDSNAQYAFPGLRLQIACQ